MRIYLGRRPPYLGPRRLFTCGHCFVDSPPNDAGIDLFGVADHASVVDVLVRKTGIRSRSRPIIFRLGS